MRTGASAERDSSLSPESSVTKAVTNPSRACMARETVFPAQTVSEGVPEFTG
jgi:hypothetical protein